MILAAKMENSSIAARNFRNIGHTGIILKYSAKKIPFTLIAKVISSKGEINKLKKSAYYGDTISAAPTNPP